MKIEVICIKRSEVYKHHRKLKIGQKYLLQDNADSIYIYIDSSIWNKNNEDFLNGLSNIIIMRHLPIMVIYKIISI